MAEEAKANSIIPPMPPLTRREFLSYAWLGSLGFVFVVGFGGAAYLFAFPRGKDGTFGGLFPLGNAGDVLPKPNDPPIHNTIGKFWLTNVNGAVLALYDICPHLGCRYDWQSNAGRFECPCHGSIFARAGKALGGPAPRNLDRMTVAFVADSRAVATTNVYGDPLQTPGEPGVQVIVDTSKIIQGETRG
jgi:cytochrome b6-f complex iron-sulfur subunit